MKNKRLGSALFALAVCGLLASLGLFVPTLGRVMLTLLSYSAELFIRLGVSNNIILYIFTFLPFYLLVLGVVVLARNSEEKNMKKKLDKLL